MKSVTPREAKRLMDEAGYRYLDVRTEEEHRAGRPAGSVNVPVLFRTPAGPSPNPDFVAEVAKVFPKGARLVVGCAAGGRSAKACEILAAAGWTDVANVDGGFSGRRAPDGTVVEGWEACGLPVERG